MAVQTFFFFKLPTNYTQNSVQTMNDHISFETVYIKHLIKPAHVNVPLALKNNI